ncbi:MAG: protein kinase domain-containing protein [Planctomycetota bacterium]|jgi:serine/threonine protein kinase
MPQIFGKYIVLKEIARGAMGVVYQAKHKNLGKTVALKALLEAHEASKDLIDRFYAEAKSAAKLQHPNIVSVHDVGISKGIFYFTMDFIEGSTLDALLEKRTLSHRGIAEILAKVAQGLHYAHHQGIIHQDVKPANILIDRGGVPFVTDFGLAKDVETEKPAPGKGPIVGTPEYMSPEQSMGQPNIDMRTDVYSTGAVLYKALTGRSVFTGTNLLKILHKVRYADPRPPSRIQKGIPKDLETICLKCLEKDPDRRYGSAEELAEDLERFAKGEPILARPPGFLETLARKAKRNRWAILGVVMAVLAIGSVYVILSKSKEADLRVVQDKLKELRSQLENKQISAGELTRMREDLERMKKEIRDPDAQKEADSLLQKIQRGESPGSGRETPEQALQEARDYWARNPKKFSQAESRFLRVVEKYPDSGACARAKKAMEKLRDGRDRFAGKLFLQTQKKAWALQANRRFGEAAALWFRVIPQIHGSPSEPKTYAEFEAALSAAWRAYEEAVLTADQLAERGGYAEARNILKKALNFGIKDIQIRVKERLKALAEREKTSLEQTQAEADQIAAAEARKAARKMAQDRLEKTMPAVFQAIQALDPDEGEAILRALAEDPVMTPLASEVAARLLDVSAVTKLLASAEETLTKAAGTGRELTLLLGKPGSEPLKRAVKIEAVEKDRIRFRTMGATTAVGRGEVHPQGWVDLGLTGLGKKSPPFQLGAGLLLHAFGENDRALVHLRLAREGGLDIDWILHVVEGAVTGHQEDRARAALARCRALFKEGNAKALEKALLEFRETFGDTRTAKEAREELDRMMKAAILPTMDASPLFSGKTRTLAAGGLEITYNFREKKEFTDWAFGRPFGMGRALQWETQNGQLMLKRAMARHNALLEGDLDLLLEVMMPDPMQPFLMCFHGLFLEYTGDPGRLLHLSRAPRKAGLGETEGSLMKGGRWTPLHILKSGGTIRITLGKNKPLSVPEPPGYHRGVLVLVGLDSPVHLRTVRIRSGINQEWVLRRKRHEVRLARGAAEMKRTSWQTLLSSGKANQWVTKPPGSWRSERGVWMAKGRAGDDQRHFTAPISFLNGAMEARIHFGGPGLFFVTLRVGAGQATVTIPPSPSTRKLEVFAFGPSIEMALDGQRLVLERPLPVAIPGNIRFTLRGEGIAALKQVRIKCGQEIPLATDRWTSLFDGKTLTGWTTKIRQVSFWTVEEGAIVGRAKGKLTGLWMEDLFKNFRLRLKVKTIKGPGPSIYVRFQNTGFCLSAPPPDDKWHTLEIVAKGHELTGFIDGIERSLANSSKDGVTYAEGSIALFVMKGQAAFKEINVIGLR